MLQSRRVFQTASRLVRRYCEVVPNNGGNYTNVTPVVGTGDRMINQVTLIGRVGSQPELRGTTERPVAIISVATSQQFRHPDGTIFPKTQWHRVCIFRPTFLQNVVPKVLKGDKVYVYGKLDYGTYEGKSGEIHKTANVIAEDFIILAQSKKQQEGNMNSFEET